MEHKNSLSPGTNLGKFTIEGILGHGGFGITYKAMDNGLNRPVAIKEYLPQDLVVRESNTSVVVAKSTSDQEAFCWGLTRFMEEAQTVARFEHKNIVTVYDSFEANDTGYMVMAYTEGETLAEKLDRLGKMGRMEEEDIFSWLYPILDGLQTVHADGILHRDLKPDNIYIPINGSAMLIDFGAARYALGSHSKNLSVVLTPGYAPNEQYSRTGKQGPWSDIYALGAILYRCVTGRDPVDAPERMQAVFAEGKEDPQPRVTSLCTGLSDKLVFVIDAALGIRPMDRPPGVPQFRQLMTKEELDASGSLEKPEPEEVEFQLTDSVKVMEFHKPVPFENKREDVEKKKASKWLIVTGYIFSILGGLIGLVLASMLVFDKTKDSNGQKVFKYDDSTRKHGKIMFLVLVTNIVGVIILRNMG